MRIGLVGCAKEKAATERAAQDLYTSALFRHRRAHVECSCNCWFILSALHGLVDPSAILALYDKALGDASRSERREWSIGVVNALTHRLGNLAAHTFEVHAGAAYRDFGLVSGLREAGAAVEATRPVGDGAQPAPLIRRAGRAPRTAPLEDYLETARSPTDLTFSEIESIIGAPLLPSARKHRAWWANSRDRTLARQWLAAGWRADAVDLTGGWIRLTR